MTLYDAFGRPVDTERLTEPQAAPTFAGIRNIYSAMHPSIGLTPEKLTGILRTAEHGDPYLYLELCQDMEEKDLHYLSVLSTRKQTVAQLEIVIQPASDAAGDKRDADFVRELLLADGGLNLQSSFVDVLDAVGKGFSATEIEWDSDGDGLGVRWLPKRLAWRDPRWFMFDWISGEQVLVRTWRNEQTLRGYGLTQPTPEGARIGIQPATEPLAPYKFVQHIAKAKSGLPIRGGLSRAASWIYLFKNYVLKDSVIFSERFGMPARLGKYGAGATKEDKDLLLRATAALGSDAAAIIPDSMQLEFVQARAAGGQRGVDIYETLLRYFDSAMSKAVLGQDMTTELPRSGGSRAAMQVGKDVRDDILRWDAARLSETLTRDLVRPVIDLNLGPRTRYPSLTMRILAGGDGKAFMDAVGAAADHGVEIGQTAIRDRLGLPAPQPGEKLLTPRQNVRPTELPSGAGDDPDRIPDVRGFTHAVQAHTGSEPPEPDTDLRMAARAVILEYDDGRDELAVWLHAPSDEPYVMLPGGGVEDGETMAEAAAREAREETGLEVEVGEWLADFVDEYGWRRYYLAERTGGVPTTRDEDGDRPVKVLRLPIADALDKLTSPFDRAALTMAVERSSGESVHAQLHRLPATMAMAYRRAVVLNARARQQGTRRRVRRPAARLEGYAQRMAEDWQLVLDPMVHPILRHVANANDLQDARARLAEVAKDMGLDEFVDVVARASFNVRAAARAKVRLP